ncbi:hypothetical protein J6590_073738, partial [Homalodisca vitripennis]
NDYYRCSCSKGAARRRVVYRKDISKEQDTLSTDLRRLPRHILAVLSGYSP